MGRQLTEEELKRFNRVLKGHLQDKDRERRKRRLLGETQAPKRRAGKSGARRLDESGDEDDPGDEQT